MFRLSRRNRLFNHRAAYEGVLGTSLEIVVSSTKPGGGQEAERRILAEIERLEAIFSIYRKESEFNLWQATQGTPVSVSADLAFVLDAAETWRKLSNGAFLPTVETLTRVWKEKQGGDAEQAHPELDLSSELWAVDKVALTAIRLTDLPASLNAIAKGYIVDRSVEVAHEVEGVRQVLVNIGGDLRHWGEGAVQVNVADPSQPAENAIPLSVVQISNQAIATSGGYRRGFNVDGAIYSHIFDPYKRIPKERLGSSSAIAKTAMLADIFATILSVLPPEAGLKLADETDSVGAFVVEGAGSYLQNNYWTRCLSATHSPTKPSRPL